MYLLKFGHWMLILIFAASIKIFLSYELQSCSKSVFKTWKGVSEQSSQNGWVLKFNKSMAKEWIKVNINEVSETFIY